MAAVNNSYVDVCFWLARGDEGFPTTSSDGQIQAKAAGKTTLARCGHVAMQIMAETGSLTHVSFVPAGFHDTLEEDIKFEAPREPRGQRSLPNVIIRLHRLNIPKMLSAFRHAKRRYRNRELRWYLNTPMNTDVLDPNTTTANCGCFVYSLLKIGGFSNKRSVYYNSIRGRGPRDGNFYQITKCNTGDRFFGISNGAFWTEWMFSPKAVLLRVASAAEANGKDVRVTKQLMRTNHVEEVLVSETGNPSAGFAAVASAVFSLARLLFSRKKAQK